MGDVSWNTDEEMTEVDALDRFPLKKGLYTSEKGVLLRMIVELSIDS